MAASRTIEARLVIAGEDRGAGAAIAKVVQTVRQMEDAAKVSKPLQEVAKVLEQVEQAQKATTAAFSARSGFAKIEADLKATRDAAAATAQALDTARKARAAFEAVKATKGSEQAAQIEAATKAVRDLTAAHRKAEADVRRVTAAVATETATLRAAEAAAARFGADLGNLEGHQQRLRAATESATNAVRAQIRVEDQAARAAAHHAREQAEFAKHQRIHGAVGAAATVASGYVGIHGVTHVIAEGAKAGAEVQSERVRLEAIRVPTAERAHIEAESLRLATEAKNVTQASVMELWKEMRSVMTDPHEVDHIIGPMVKAKSILDAQDKTGTASHGLNLLVKGAESIGAAKDPERFTHLLDGYVKAMQVMGKTITPEGIYEMQKYSKAAGARWSDRFILTTAQSLGQEMGGSTAGNSIQMAQKQIVGGMQNLHSKAKEFARIGLIDAKNLDYLKTGEVKGVKAGVKHAVKGDDLAATDLDQWIYSILLPHLRDAGVKAEGDQLGWVQKNFTGTAADVISKLIVQRESFEAHARMYQDASGLEGQKFNRDDATAALGAVSKSFETFLGVLTSPVMRDAAHVLDSFAGGIGAVSLRLEEFNKSHPTLAKVEGAAAAGAGLAGAGLASAAVYRAMSSGFGLKTSAVALDGSAAAHVRAAAALTEAAVALGTKGAVPEVVKDAAKVTTGGAAAAGESVLARALPVFGRLGGVLAPVLMLRELGEAHRPMTPEGAPYRLDQAIDTGTWERAYRHKREMILDPEGARGREMMRRDRAQADAAANALPAPSMTLAPGAMPLTIQGTGIGGFGLSGPVDPETAGKQAGEKVGEGVADGIQAKAPEVEEQGKTLFQRLKETFSQGIFVPINFTMGDGAGGSGIQKASFGGDGGGLGGLIHRASLGDGDLGRGIGGGGVGGLVRGASGSSGGGGSALPIPASVQASDYERIALGLIQKYESGGRKVPNYMFDRRHTAQGYYQITNSNWRNIAPKLGITAPNAMSASHADQARVALYLLRGSGIGNWTPKVAAALRRGDRARFGANSVPGTVTAKDPAALDPHFVKGLDGKEGLDLGNGTMKMPDGAIRSIPRQSSLTIPDPPEGGFGGGGRRSMERAAERMHEAVDRFEGAGFHGQVSVSLSGSGARQARVTGLKVRGRGGVTADMGVSMPGAKESDDDWS